MKKNIFETIKVRKPNYSVFDLSHERKTSANMGELIPIFVEDVLPGDKFTVNSEIFMRLAPMVAPMMHRVNVFTHFFFVPNRLIWNEWEKFITGGEDGTEDPGFPKLTFDNDNKTEVAKGSLADYLGIPDFSAMITAGDSIEVSALPFRAYQMIYNEYYRDQNLTEKIDFSIGSTLDVDDPDNLVAIRKRAWEKDYFTSALPWAQRGASAGVPVDYSYMDQSEVYQDDGTNPLNGSNLQAHGTGLSNAASELLRVENLADEVKVDINALRTAIKLQEWLERNARGGSRYIEQIFSHFGVRSSDARLQRPEYLGGGKQPIVISEVLNMTGTEDAPQGAMAGHGVSMGNTNKFSRRFEEHGIIIGIMSVLPVTAYFQGLPRAWRKFDKFDYFFPEFANMGEQEINTWELYCDPSDADSMLAKFGYQQRYAEYKYKPSTVHGDFKDTLEFWHMARKFSNPPNLNTSFIESNPTDRIFAVQDSTDKLWIQIYNHVYARRPLPYYNIPSIL